MKYIFPIMESNQERKNMLRLKVTLPTKIQGNADKKNLIKLFPTVF